MKLPKTLFPIESVDKDKKSLIGYVTPNTLFPTGSAPCFVTRMSSEQLKEANLKAKERFLNLKK